MVQDAQERLERSGLELASLQKRALAFLVDELILAALFLVILYDQIAGIQDPEAMADIINSYTFEYLILKVIYQTLFIYMYGATLGKMAMKIAVVDAYTMQKPIFSSALNRAVFRIISEILFYLGFVWAFYTEGRQTWHDKTARTLVVNV